MTEDNYKPFSFEEYVLNIQSEDFKKEQLKRLFHNHRLQRTIDRENIAILSTFSDPEKRSEIFKSVCQVWSGVLESDTETSSIDDIINTTLSTEDSIKFLYENKHTNYFPTGEVFNKHIEHPVQKELTKSKHLGKRQANKQKTPMQAISYVYTAKSNSDRDKRLQEIEKSLAEAHHMISLLAVNQLGLTIQTENTNQQLLDVQQRLSVVEDKVKDDRKIKLYALYTSNKKTTNSELATEIGVNVRTIKRWLAELRVLGVID